MKKLNKILIGVLTTLFIFLTTSHTFADDVDVTGSFSVSGSDLILDIEDNTTVFDSIKISDINNTNESITRTSSIGDIVVNDARGELSGYTIQVSATRFHNEEKDFSLNDEILTLDASNIDISGHSQNETFSTLGETIIDSNNGTNISLITAPEGSGYGINTFAFDDDALKLNLAQKKVMSGTYESTITFTIVEGP